MPDPYRIERISPDNLNDFLSLYNIVYSQNATINKYQHKFNTKKFGAEYIGYLAYTNSGSPVAYYGVFPIQLYLHGNIILGAQSGDTMTHPLHRKRGLFITLAERTFALAKEAGIKIIYGIPNMNSYRGFQKLGWITQGEMSSCRLELNPPIWRKLLRKLNITPYKAYSSKILKAKKLTNPPSLFINKEEGFCVARNTSFFDYKNDINNHFLEFDNGFAWVKIDGYNAFLGDFRIKNNASGDLFWKELKLFCMKIGAHSISFYFSPSLKEKYLLPSNYLYSKDLPILIHHIGLHVPIDLALVGADYDTF